ncbi:hypothetical protein EWM64_g2027 [Hericium alpestre]|uniref:Ribonuclease H1 N-terminal domain-containing protein n=1 Tax=Hericium alpestre TaxID=135208 RepID=A0A4Z0A6T3_9AGAM|nr:hypothetical protein EWM64_g2027 [Hericium alpestre]
MVHLEIDIDTEEINKLSNHFGSIWLSFKPVHSQQANLSPADPSPADPSPADLSRTDPPEAQPRGGDHTHPQEEQPADREPATYNQMDKKRPPLPSDKLDTGNAFESCHGIRADYLSSDEPRSFYVIFADRQPGVFNYIRFITRYTSGLQDAVWAEYSHYQAAYAAYTTAKVADQLMVIDEDPIAPDSEPVQGKGKGKADGSDESNEHPSFSLFAHTFPRPANFGGFQRERPAPHFDKSFSMQSTTSQAQNATSLSSREAGDSQALVLIFGPGEIPINPRSKKNKQKAWAVFIGRRLGIYLTWKDAERQVHRAGRCDHLSFGTIEEAEDEY